MLTPRRLEVIGQILTGILWRDVHNVIGRNGNHIAESLLAPSVFVHAGFIDDAFARIDHDPGIPQSDFRPQVVTQIQDQARFKTNRSTKQAKQIRILSTTTLLGFE
jgi:hypothetical protein